MSLDAQLSALLDEVPGNAFARGRAYFGAGKVSHLGVEGDRLVGVVDGTGRYQVAIEATRRGLVVRCDCPAEVPMCKHVVALALAYLAKNEAPPPPRSATERPFESRRELERWARQHGVLDALQLSAEPLLGLLGDGASPLRYLLPRLGLGDLASVEGSTRYAHDRALAARIAQAARQALDAAVEDAAQALREEEARGEAPPDPALAPLWTKLLAARQSARVLAAPRSRASRATGKWSFDPAVPAISWRDGDRTVAYALDYGARAATARLTLPSDGEPQIECDCGAPDGGCSHGLALLDATLDLVADPARNDEARAAAEALLRPGWARALFELERIEQRAEKPRAAIEVWWSLETMLGGVTLTPTVKRQTRRGAMSSGARMSASRLLADHRDALDDADRQIAEALSSWTQPSRAGGSYPSRAFVALVGHPRVLYEEAPLTVARAPLGFTAQPAGEDIRIEPTVDGERLPPRHLSQLLREFAPGEPLLLHLPSQARCLLVDVSDEARRLWLALERHGDHFPPESHGQLLERLARLEARLPIAVPERLKGRQIAASSTVVLRLRLTPGATLELELFIRPGPGAPLYHPGAGPRDVLIATAGERAYVRRQLGDEPERARAQLAVLPLDGALEGPPCCYHLGDSDGALRLVAALAAPPPGVEVEWIDPPPVVHRAVGPEHLRVHIDRKRDWFGIVGELKIESGRLELAVLLDAARRQQRFVRAGERSFVELSDTLQERLLAVADQTYSGRGKLELSPGAVPAVRALGEAGATVEEGPAWRELAARLGSSLTLVPRPPPSLAKTLRDYQIEGHAWLTRVAAWGAGACLADDMGLGKTVQAIALLLDRARHGPALVLAPTSVALNWVAELERFAPGLTPVLLSAADDRARCLARLRKRDVLIVTYGLLVREAALLAQTKFATLIVDEAQALKNPTTHRARAARTLDAGFRVALSGTPFENHLGELWSLFAIVFPGLLGSWDQFRERYAAPIEREKDPAARAALSRVLRPFLLRRTKAEVARELPARTEIQVPVALSKDEWALYEDARLAALAELSVQGKGVRNEQQRFQVLAALTRLRLLASHPRLYDASSPVASSKLRRLLELLEELRSEGHRALVFSQFTSHLALAREALDQAGFTYQYLDGSTPAGMRKQRIEAFQRGEGELFLISLKAGGTGVNLTAADNVIHLDPWWNPAVEDQASDRAHRIGQTRPVTVYRLITRGTIEEQILSLHGDKRALVAGILDGSDVAARLTTRDLLALLEGGEAPIADDDEREPATPRGPPTLTVVKGR